MADKETVQQKKDREAAEAEAEKRAKLKRETDEANAKLEKESDEHLQKHNAHLAVAKKEQEEAAKK